MTTITEFLLVRIAEDDVSARECSEPIIEGNWRTYANDVGTVAMTKTRALAECAAKRAIVDRETSQRTHELPSPAELLEGPKGDGWTYHRTGTVTDTPILRHLAAVYADHPDYREEWRP